MAVVTVVGAVHPVRRPARVGLDAHDSQLGMTLEHRAEDQRADDVLVPAHDRHEAVELRAAYLRRARHVAAAREDVERRRHTEIDDRVPELVVHRVVVILLRRDARQHDALADRAPSSPRGRGSPPRACAPRSGPVRSDARARSRRTRRSNGCTRRSTRAGSRRRGSCTAACRPTDRSLPRRRRRCPGRRGARQGPSRRATDHRIACRCRAAPLRWVGPAAATSQNGTRLLPLSINMTSPSARGSACAARGRGTSDRCDRRRCRAAR